ncbi:MAG: thioredoxin domain-containing protein [bacterium]|nr:thioredoxin domain-containing protein [bacterium]
MSRDKTVSRNKTDRTAISRRLASALRALAAIGVASALWAVFLWRELLRSRAGETPFCGFGESQDCADLWSAAFATNIHHWTGMPVAGWGLVWSLVAAALPLVALASRDRESRLAAACSGIGLTATAGVAGIVVLLGASAAEGMFCKSCALTYVLTVAYAVVAWRGLRRGSHKRSPHGITVAAGLTAAAYLALLVPGLKTPKSLTAEGQRALEAASRPVGSAEATATAEDDAGGPRREASAPEHDRVLREFLASLPPQALQALSDSLHIYRGSAAFEPEEPRTLAVGTPGAPVLITEFTDALCGHCGTLHQTIGTLETLVSSSFAVDARHFPLDGNCNPHLKVRGPETVRCLAARAQICVEGTGFGFQFAGALFQSQQNLTADDVFGLAAPFIGRTALERCLASPETETKLRQDVDYAWRYEPDGTPLVLINGRVGTSFGPFLYAMVLAAGDADHPAFASLPEPRPDAHMH